MIRHRHRPEATGLLGLSLALLLALALPALSSGAAQRRTPAARSAAPTQRWMP